MSEAVQTYQEPTKLSALFLNPAGDLRDDTKQGTYRFPSKYKTLLAADIVDFFQENKKSFQIKEFCQAKGLTYQDLLEMAKDNSTLCRALQFARESCEARLVQMGKDSPTMIALALKNLHEWRDRQSSDDARQQIVVNLHLPGREGAVMAKYEIIEDKAKKRSRRGAKVALEKLNKNEEG